MLAVLAAIVPILASLYAAGSLLVEYASRNHAARVAERVWARYNEERAQLRHISGTHEKRRAGEEILARRKLLLEANGLDPWTGATRDLNETLRPKPMPAVELRRQWVLLLGSAVGVVLLAVDML